MCAFYFCRYGRILFFGVCFPHNYTQLSLCLHAVCSQTVCTLSTHTHSTLGGSQQHVHFLPPVKAHLSQLLFWRGQERKKECASLRFPDDPSPIPALTYLSNYSHRHQPPSSSTLTSHLSLSRCCCFFFAFSPIIYLTLVILLLHLLHLSSFTFTNTWWSHIPALTFMK